MEPMRVGIVGFGNVGQELRSAPCWGRYSEYAPCGRLLPGLGKGPQGRRVGRTRRAVMTLPQIVEASAVIAECATAAASRK